MAVVLLYLAAFEEVVRCASTSSFVECPFARGVSFSQRFDWILGRTAPFDQTTDPSSIDRTHACCGVCAILSRRWLEPAADTTSVAALSVRLTTEAAGLRLRFGDGRLSFLSVTEVTSAATACSSSGMVVLRFTGFAAFGVSSGRSRPSLTRTASLELRLDFRGGARGFVDVANGTPSAPGTSSCTWLSCRGKGALIGIRLLTTCNGGDCGR